MTTVAALKGPTSLGRLQRRDVAHELASRLGDSPDVTTAVAGVEVHLGDLAGGVHEAGVQAVARRTGLGRHGVVGRTPRAPVVTAATKVPYRSLRHRMAQTMARRSRTRLSS